MYKLITLSFFWVYFSALAQPVQPVRIHYDGGGDWYGNKTTWINILEKARTELDLKVAPKEKALRITDLEFYQHPIAYIAGHGNISFTENEADRLRTFLTSGGFLWADDDYGMDTSFRRSMKKVFPELKFVELPFSHPIYHNFYDFDNGLPKIHEHDGGAPRGYGLIYQDRLVCFYSFNTDISDGCEDANIHNDPEYKRNQALKMAVNILLYALLN
ncbi:MAG: DUF4159 domain-containing protein [Caldithrix sp.]|nr:DUF4159 domain-containing protein [Caldithrix sp.]